MTMTKQNRKTALFGLLFLMGLGVGLSQHWIAPLPPAAAIGVTVVVLGLVTWASFYCWTLMDEAQREAHKWAWYWGGSLGLMVGLVGVMVALRIDPHLAEAINPKGSSKAFVELGLWAAATSTLIGYGVAWAAWWMTRR